MRGRLGREYSGDVGKHARGREGKGEEDRGDRGERGVRRDGDRGDRGDRGGRGREAGPSEEEAWRGRLGARVGLCVIAVHQGLTGRTQASSRNPDA